MKLISDKFEDEGLRDQIKLDLRVIDFEDTTFGSNCNCAISKAIKRQIGNIENVSEEVESTKINGSWYDHKPYGSKIFHFDSERSIGLPSQYIIRTIILTKRK